MDTDKILLDIHGKVSGTEADVKHLSTKFDDLNGKVRTLHKRVDKHGRIIAYGSGLLGAAWVAIKMYKIKLFG